jgi:hypothetical protein
VLDISPVISRAASRCFSASSSLCDLWIARVAFLIYQTETNQHFAAQFPRNLAANIAYFLVSIVIGVLLIPYFIDTLGSAGSNES